MKAAMTAMVKGDFAIDVVILLVTPIERSNSNVTAAANRSKPSSMIFPAELG